MHQSKISTMKKTTENIEKKRKVPKTTTFGLNRKKILKPRFIWWGWKTI